MSFCSERQNVLKFCVIYMVCNTNQNKLSAASVKNMQQESIWHIFLFCSISEKNSTNIWHLSGELIGWSRRPSVRPRVRGCVNTFKHEYLRDQRTDRHQILSEASVRWQSIEVRESCIRF